MVKGKSGKKSVRGWAALVLVLYALVLGVLPWFVTRIIFEHGSWLARFIVYMAVLTAVAYGIRAYKADLYVYRWIKQRFGVRVF